MTEFFHQHPTLGLFLVFWFSGSALLFIWTTVSMLWRFIQQNSVRNQNLWLIGLTMNWLNGQLDEPYVGKKSWKEQAQLLGGGILLMAFNSVIMSWVGIVFAVFGILTVVYKRLTVPAKIREYSWRAGNIRYRRAEDYMQLLQESYLPGSPVPSIQTVEEAQEKVKGITREYAKKVFPDDNEATEKYVELAKALSKKHFASEIIHPSFWMIPAKKDAAEHAVNFRFQDSNNKH